MSCQTIPISDILFTNGTSCRYVIIEDFYSIGEEPRDDVDGQERDLYAELIKSPQHRYIKPVDERHTLIESHMLYERDGYGQGRELRREDDCLSFDFFDNTPELLRGLNSKMKDSMPSGFRTRHSTSSITSRPSEQRKIKPEKPFGNIEFGLTRRHILGASDINKHNNGQDIGHLPLGGVSESASSRLKQFKELSTSPIVYPNLQEKKRKRNEPFGDIDPNLNPRVVKYTKRTEEMSFVSAGHKIINLPSELERGRTTVSNFMKASHEKSFENRPMAAKIKRETLHNADRATKSPKWGNQAPTVSPTATAERQTAPNPSRFKKTKALLPINRPLNICPLGSLTGQNATRNKVQDVFAVICSVEESVVKPPKGMPLKRDIRIMDPSTDKKVLVSVFVDPETFKPAVGTVALFRSLTTHEWDRGMLNVYANMCAGRAWFLKDPVGVDGCDVKALKEWWESKKSELAPR